MDLYTAEQVKTIRHAIGAARRALAACGRFRPIEFARVFVRHAGIQIPGRPQDVELADKVASELLRSLELAAQTHDDVHVGRELHRARIECEWAELAGDEQVVGIRVVLGSESSALTLCRMALEQDFGLGAGVFPCSRIIVLAPACQDYRIAPVTAHEVEQ